MHSVLDSEFILISRGELLEVRKNQNYSDLVLKKEIGLFDIIKFFCYLLI